MKFMEEKLCEIVENDTLNAEYSFRVLFLNIESNQTALHRPYI